MSDRANEGIGVERTDFVGIYTQDLERAKQFYGETLGLKRNERSSDEGPSSRRAT
jgi:catechol 2,3-dioxygenase-like lactoylglutathione lyase family enzyme